MSVAEFTLNECTRQNLCVDCDNASCAHSGKLIADCPKYHCDRPDELLEDCESCSFLKQFQREMREMYSQEDKEKEGKADGSDQINSDERNT